MERTIRYSKKREAILAAIRGTSCHPSAEWIYQQLKPRHPDLSSPGRRRQLCPPSPAERL